MAENTDKDRAYKDLWPLHGGSGHYVETLLEILDWVERSGRPSVQQLRAWMHKKYGHSYGSVGRYAGVPEEWRCVEIKADGHDKRVYLTERGRRLVVSRDPGIIRDALLCERVPAYDVLETIRRVGAANDESVMAQIGSRYPRWKSSGPYGRYLGWLHSVGCLEKSRSGYTITTIGQNALRQYASVVATKASRAGRSAEAVGDSAATHAAATNAMHTLNQKTELAAKGDTADVGDEHDTSPPMHLVADEAGDLAERICVAALQSEDSAQFERTIAEAFEFLGFEAEHRSGPGDTDVLVKAPLGKNTYRAVVDGKSSRHGKVGKHQIDWYALQRHKEKHGAAYILIVAPDFSAGDLLDSANKAGAALIKASDLADLLRLHAVTPLSLSDLRALFLHPGDPELPLQRIQDRAAEVARLQQLLPDIIRTFQEAQRRGTTVLTTGQLIYGIARDYGREVYCEEEVSEAVTLLCSPQIGALGRLDTSFALQMPPSSIVRRFRALTQQFSDASLADREPRA